MQGFTETMKLNELTAMILADMQALPEEAEFILSLHTGAVKARITLEVLREPTIEKRAQKLLLGDIFMKELLEPLGRIGTVSEFFIKHCDPEGKMKEYLNDLNASNE